MSLLLPLGLAALLALAIPLLLHLHRRQEPRDTPFAALAFVRGAARPRRRLRLEQWPLLLLRLLLLAAFALLLAAPVRDDAGLPGKDWVVVAPGLSAAQARTGLAAPDARWHWLLPGFPELAERTPAADEAAPIASLLRELDSELDPDARLRVVVPAQLQGLDGAAIRLSRAVEWQVVNGAPGVPAPRAVPAPRRISLRGSDSAAAPYLRAAVAAWNRDAATRYPLVEEAPDAALDASTAIVFWLAGATTPALQQWIEAGGTALVDAGGLERAEPVAHDAAGAALLLQRREGRGRLLSFSAPLTPAALPLLLDAAFATTLETAVQPPAAAPDQAFAAAVQPQTGATRADPAPRPLDGALILLLALLALAERALSLAATRRRT